MANLTARDEIEILPDMELTGEQEIIVELHSVINLINALYGCLELLEIELHGSLGSAKAMVMELAEKINIASQRQMPLEINPYFANIIATALNQAWESHSFIGENKDAIELKHTVSSILAVFQVRLEELQERMAKPDEWLEFSAKKLTDSINQALAAIEENARGRYRIVDNIAQQTPNDYQISLKISSSFGDLFFMPPVLQDVLRDLIANARKYTPLGGKINAGLHVSETGIRLVVEDNGIGIPVNEINKVAHFGYRASNVAGKRTLGGGFGLTKALGVAKKWGGRMWIASRVNVGTRVTLQLPPRSITQNKN